jgi:hypothetical protein
VTCLNPTLRPETLAAGESLIVARRVAVALLSTGEPKFGLQSDAVNCLWRFEVQKGYVPNSSLNLIVMFGITQNSLNEFRTMR